MRLPHVLRQRSAHVAPIQMSVRKLPRATGKLRGQSRPGASSLTRYRSWPPPCARGIPAPRSAGYRSACRASWSVPPAGTRGTGRAPALVHGGAPSAISNTGRPPPTRLDAPLAAGGQTHFTHQPPAPPARTPSRVPSSRHGAHTHLLLEPRVRSHAEMEMGASCARCWGESEARSQRDSHWSGTAAGSPVVRSRCVPYKLSPVSLFVAKDAFAIYQK